MSRVETHLTIRVPADNVESYRQLASYFPGGVGMFVTPLYLKNEPAVIDGNGNPIPVQYISSGKIDRAVAEALDDPAGFAAQVGANIEEVTALRASMIISTREDVHAELSELNLSLTPMETDI